MPHTCEACKRAEELEETARDLEYDMTVLISSLQGLLCEIKGARGKKRVCDTNLRALAKLIKPRMETIIDKMDKEGEG